MKRVARVGALSVLAVALLAGFTVGTASANDGRNHASGIQTAGLSSHVEVDVVPVGVGVRVGRGFYGRGFYGRGYYGRGFYGRGYYGRGFNGRGYYYGRKPYYGKKGLKKGGKKGIRGRRGVRGRSSRGRSARGRR